MKIAVMITGGTFDSQPSDEGGGLKVSRYFQPERYRELIALARKEFPEVDFELVKSPKRIDSSQLTPDWIQKLIWNIQSVVFRSDAF